MERRKKMIIVETLRGVQWLQSAAKHFDGAIKENGRKSKRRDGRLTLAVSLCRTPMRCPRFVGVFAAVLNI